MSAPIDTRAPRRRVLVVEDEWIIASDIKRILEQGGLEVAGVATRAATAASIFRSAAPELLLMDISLDQGADGVELAAQLRAEREVPVVFVSAYAGHHNVARAREIGACGFVVKPFSDEQLCATVEVALANAGGGRLRRAEEALARIAAIVDGAGVTSPTPVSHPALAALTRREREVLDGLLRNRRVAQIARDIDRSPQTVRNHLKNVFKKLGVGSQVELLDVLVGHASSRT